MTHKIPWQYLVIAIGALALAGCGGGSASGETEPAAELLFSPLGGAVPSPNDLGFQGSQDGTLNLTEVTPTGETEPLDSQVSVNSTDGFSTLASATAKFTTAVDGDTIVPGVNVHVFAVTTAGDPNTHSPPADPAGPKGVTGLDAVAPYPAGVLTAGTHYTAGLSGADPTNTTLAITPLQPLLPDQTFMVVVTDGIESGSGDAIGTSEQYQLAKSTTPLIDGGGNSLVEDLTDDQAQTLEGIRQLVNSHVAVATAATGAASEDIIATWTFTTQTIGRTLDTVRTDIQGMNPVFVDTAGTPNELTEIDPAALPISIPEGKILTGALAGVPYYLEPGSGDPQNVRTGFWRQADGSILTPANRMPANNVPANFAIPVLVALPVNDGAGPSNVVIFQHGITSNRTAMLAIANALTAQNLAVVAIDLPLHGITDTGNGLYAGSAERTFNVDLVDNDTGAPGPDGQIDPSGEHFINLSSLQTSRDNLRQAAADLFTLTRAILDAAISGADLDTDADTDFTNNIRFLGHSLGGIVGGPFLATEPNVSTAVLAMSGGGIAKLLDGSPQIGPQIETGLAGNGLVKGLSGYEQFLGAAQTVVDTGDPVNYTTRTALGGTAQPSGNTIPDRNVLELEVVGGNSSPPDQVVPNNVVRPFQQGIPDGTVPSPAAGTDPLVRLMMMQQRNMNPGAAGDYVIRYTTGGHASLLDPSADAAATTEMQTNVTSFLASDGTIIQFAGTGTVAAP